MPSRIYDNLSFTKISVSNSHSAALSEGNIVGWGSPAKDKLNFPSEHNYIDVSCGYSHSAAVTDDGMLISVGNGNDGKTVVDNTIFHKSVRCSRNYTAAQVEIDGKDAIVVYGDQSIYKSLPSSLYRLSGKFVGIFNIANVAHYDITDDGEIIVINDATEMFTISGSKRVLYANLHRPAVSLVRGSLDSIAMYLCDDGSAFRVSIDENGNPKRDHLGSDIVAIFSGKTFYGCANANSLTLNGEHFGNIKLPDGWQIKSAVGGNNGYAIIVSDDNGVLHTILCGDNTKNKELVIEGRESRENIRMKDSIKVSMQNMVYEVRKAKEKKAPVVVNAVTSGAESDYECEPCGYKFMSTQPKCPLCKCEVAVHA